MMLYLKNKCYLRFCILGCIFTTRSPSPKISDYEVAESEKKAFMRSNIFLLRGARNRLAKKIEASRASINPDYYFNLFHAKRELENYLGALRQFPAAIEIYDDLESSLNVPPTNLAPVEAAQFLCLRDEALLVLLDERLAGLQDLF